MNLCRFLPACAWRGQLAELAAAVPMENPYCSCKLTRGKVESRFTAAVPVENP